jgi:hypothetical protein
MPGALLGATGPSTSHGFFSGRNHSADRYAFPHVPDWLRKKAGAKTQDENIKRRSERKDAIRNASLPLSPVASGPPKSTRGAKQIPRNSLKTKKSAPLQDDP